MRLRIVAIVTLWAYEHIPNDYPKIRRLAEGLINETRKLYLDELPKFIIQFRGVLEYRQLFHIRQLAQRLRSDFYQAFMYPSESAYQDQNANYQEVFPKVEDCWQSEIIKIIEFFDIQHGWIEHFVKLEEYLRVISSGENLDLLVAPYVINPDIIIVWAYGQDNKYGNYLREIIDHILDLKRPDNS